jgi:hypothetical protein
MKRPTESDYTSHVAYARALEEYCDTLAQPAQEPMLLNRPELATLKHSATAYKLAQNELDRLVKDNFGQMPRNDQWTDSVLDLRDAQEQVAQPAPVQEPVAWMTQARNFVNLMEFTEAEAKLYGWAPVYIAPPAAAKEENT